MLRNFIHLRRLFCSPKSPYFSELEARQLVEAPNQLRQAMIEQISDYWKQALTDDKHGYYRQQNVFSREGDFTTSPEISPLFGEMVATWLTVFLQHPKVAVMDPATGKINKKFRLVELGGGRGMLMQDILRSFRSYGITQNFDLSFIEVSEFNRGQQQQRVLQQMKQAKRFYRFDHENASPLKEQFLAENEGSDMKLSWYGRLEDLLTADHQNKEKGIQPPITLFVMNEFFDALPVTVIEYTQDGWRERVLKVAEDTRMYFQVGTSSHPLHEKMQPRASKPELGDIIQLSPQSLLTMDMMSKIVRYSGGAIINIDYGGQGPFVDSIRAIKEHKFVPHPYFWQVPGTCDLSAHVSFSSLAQYAQRTEGVKAFELIPQQFFLEAMGIMTRLQILSKGRSKQKVERLEGEVKRLTDPQQMGDNFKVQMISLSEYGEIYPHITVDPNVF